MVPAEILIWRQHILLRGYCGLRAESLASFAPPLYRRYSARRLVVAVVDPAGPVFAQGTVLYQRLTDFFTSSL